MTKSKYPATKLHPTRKKVQMALAKANREMMLGEVRVPGVTLGTVEDSLRAMGSDNQLLRRWVKAKPGGRAFWVYRAFDVEMNPAYVNADDPSVASAKPKPVVVKEAKVKATAVKPSAKEPYIKIMAKEPESHKIMRDLPRGSEQVDDELYLMDYYDPAHPNYLKDTRDMKIISHDASGNVVQIVRDAANLQKVTALSPPNWAAVNSLAQSLLFSSASLMKESIDNLQSEANDVSA
jgi:hypothetical protein